jgi:hypothetical protein
VPARSRAVNRTTRAGRRDAGRRGDRRRRAGRDRCRAARSSPRPDPAGPLPGGGRLVRDYLRRRDTAAGAVLRRALRRHRRIPSQGGGGGRAAGRRARAAWHPGASSRWATPRTDCGASWMATAISSRPASSRRCSAGRSTRCTRRWRRSAWRTRSSRCSAGRSSRCSGSAPTTTTGPRRTTRHAARRANGTCTRLADGAADAPPLPLSERRWGADIEPRGGVRGAAAGRRSRTDVVRGTCARPTPDATVAASFTARAVPAAGSAHRADQLGAPALRRAAAPVLRARRSGGRARGDRAPDARLVEAGYPAQVAITPDASNLMLLDEHGRDRLVRGAPGWHTRRERRRCGGGAAARSTRSRSVLAQRAAAAGGRERRAADHRVRRGAGRAELLRADRLSLPCARHAAARGGGAAERGCSSRKVRRALDRLGLHPTTFARPMRSCVAAVSPAEVPAESGGAAAAATNCCGTATPS